MVNQPFLQQDLENVALYASQQDIEKSLETNNLAHKILDEILAKVHPGCSESEVKKQAYAIYEAYAVERPWHMPYIRFGFNTLLTYKDKAKEDLILNESDIAFGDIGIVKNGIEGDAGRTITFGSNTIFKELEEASKSIFDEMVDYWRHKNPTGIELYTAVQKEIERKGFVFNLDPAGHLIGTFPHKGWKHGLNHFSGVVEKGIWVLEIQLRHAQLAYGAFYEALLT